MLPRRPDNHPDLFRANLSQILNLRHPLVRLSEQMDWAGLEEKVDAQHSPGPGQPPLPTRLLVGLHYLKHAFDESVVARWLENPYWQYFCGYEHLQHEPPLHPSSLVRWRERPPTYFRDGYNNEYYIMDLALSRRCRFDIG